MANYSLSKNVESLVPGQEHVWIARTTRIVVVTGKWPDTHASVDLLAKFIPDGTKAAINFNAITSLTDLWAAITKKANSTGSIINALRTYEAHFQSMPAHGDFIVWAQGAYNIYCSVNKGVIPKDDDITTLALTVRLVAHLPPEAQTIFSAKDEDLTKWTSFIDRLSSWQGSRKSGQLTSSAVLASTTNLSTTAVAHEEVQFARNNSWRGGRGRRGRGRGRLDHDDDKNGVCTRCGHTGHILANCFAKRHLNGQVLLSQPVVESLFERNRRSANLARTVDDVDGRDDYDDDTVDDKDNFSLNTKLARDFLENQGFVIKKGD